MNIRLVVAVALALSTSAPPVGARQTQATTPPPGQQEDVVRITTNLVQVDVIVTDKEGRHVTDLRPEDFEVVENGKKQQITNFSFVTAAGAAEAGAAARGEKPGEKPGAPPVEPARLRREHVRRTIALVVDDLGLSFESLSLTRRALAKFVDEQMQPTDMVAVLRTSGGVGVLQQFTSDKRQLHAAIERVRWYPAGRGGIDPVNPLNEQSINADIRDNIQFSEELEESRAGQFSVGTLGAVSSIIRGLGDMPGRKSVVLISEALRMFSAQGRNVRLVQALRALTDEANANSVAIYTLDASGLQSYTFEARDRVAGYSYVIDPQTMSNAGAGAGAGGVQVNPPPRTLPRADTLNEAAERDSGAAFRRLGALMNMREQQQSETHTVLSYLAQRTGGLFLRNRNDIGAGIGQIMTDQSGYYLIGYRPDEATVGAAAARPRLRNLEVKVKRSGLKVRTRDAYAGVTEEDRRARPRTRDERLTAALISPFAPNEIGLRLTSLFGDEPGGGAYMRSLLHIDARDLQFKEEAGGARSAELEMLAVAFGDNGQIVDQFGYPQTVRVASEAEYQQVLENGLVYILNFPIKRGGPYQMRVAVRDAASERVGAAMQFVEAPDLGKNRLALSGIILSGLEPTSQTADPQSGPAVRRLRQGMLLDYRYNVYHAQAGPAGPQVQTQMRLFRDGQTVFTGKALPLDASQQKNLKRLNAAGRLRLGPDLIPGDYLLQVVVTDGLAPEGRRTSTQWIDFQIVK